MINTDWDILAVATGQIGAAIVGAYLLSWDVKSFWGILLLTWCLIPHTKKAW